MRGETRMEIRPSVPVRDMPGGRGITTLPRAGLEGYGGTRSRRRRCSLAGSRGAALGGGNPCAIVARGRA